MKKTNIFYHIIFNQIFLSSFWDISSSVSKRILKYPRNLKSKMFLNKNMLRNWNFLSYVAEHCASFWEKNVPATFFCLCFFFVLATFLFVFGTSLTGLGTPKFYSVFWLYIIGVHNSPHKSLRRKWRNTSRSLWKTLIQHFNKNINQLAHVPSNTP